MNDNRQLERERMRNPLNNRTFSAQDARDLALAVTYSAWAEQLAAAPLLLSTWERRDVEPRGNGDA